MKLSLLSRELIEVVRSGLTLRMFSKGTKFVNLVSDTRIVPFGLKMLLRLDNRSEAKDSFRN